MDDIFRIFPSDNNLYNTPELDRRIDVDRGFRRLGLPPPSYNKTSFEELFAHISLPDRTDRGLVIWSNNGVFFLFGVVVKCLGPSTPGRRAAITLLRFLFGWRLSLERFTAVSATPSTQLPGAAMSRIVILGSSTTSLLYKLQ